jgi:hypothetical protein
MRPCARAAHTTLQQPDTRANGASRNAVHTLLLDQSWQGEKQNAEEDEQALPPERPNRSLPL